MANNSTQYFKLDTGAQTRAEICAQIVQIDAIISALLVTALLSVSKANVVEYEINTGQTKQRVEYSDPKQVTDAIENYKRIRGMLRADLTPRRVQLRHGKNFN